jgi:hypothetical protein
MQFGIESLFHLLFGRRSGHLNLDFGHNLSSYGTQVSPMSADINRFRGVSSTRSEV